jgi:hypothetical protein
MKSEKSRRAAHTLACSICVSLLFWGLHGPVLGSRRDEPISLPGADWELAMKPASASPEETQPGGEREWERGEALFLEVEVHVVKRSFKQYQQKTLDSLTDSLEISPGEGFRASS